MVDKVEIEVCNKGWLVTVHKPICYGGTNSPARYAYEDWKKVLALLDVTCAPDAKEKIANCLQQGKTETPKE